MNRFKGAAIVAILATPVVVAGMPASASTARQYTFQGQGLYVTSKGLPENVIGIPSAQQQGLTGQAQQIQLLQVTL